MAPPHPLALKPERPPVKRNPQDPLARSTLPVLSEAVTGPVPRVVQTPNTAPKEIKIIRVDPEKRTIAMRKMRCGKTAVSEVRRIVKAKDLGHKRISQMIVDGAEVPIIVAVGINLPDSAKEWRIRGSEFTAGIGILFGQGPGGGMVDVPVDVDWATKMIIWKEDA